MYIEEADWLTSDLARRLREAGVSTISDLNFTSTKLLMKLDVGRDEAAAILRRVSQDSLFRRGSVIMERGEGRMLLKTGVRGLDDLLGGGVKTGLVTDFFGVSGSGKTQLCFQLCVNASQPLEAGGLDSSILFVDTAGTFRPERIFEMAEARGMDGQKILESVFVLRARSVAEQLEASKRILEAVWSRNVKLILIDTLTDNFVTEFRGEDQLVKRQTGLVRHLHELALLALRRNLVVVVTNTVRSRLGVTGDLVEEGLEETGGHVVSQGVHFRVRLLRTRGVWVAELVQPCLNRVLKAEYIVTSRGVIDLN